MRVLFFAEAVTLAHVARPIALASSLSDRQVETHFALNPVFSAYTGSLPGEEHPLWSISPEEFSKALARGQPLYDVQTLERYVREDLDMIEKIAPDIIVGDFRLSLAVSSEVVGVPYVSISNTYWSPFVRQRYPVPSLDIVRIAGLGVSQVLFDIIRPLAFRRHTRALNVVRKKYGQIPLGGDLRTTYTRADHTVYADIPKIFDTAPMPDNHHFIGPITWDSEARLPEWWGDIPNDKPVVYVTAGSSGAGEVIGLIVPVLLQMDCTVVVSTAGKQLHPLPRSRNLFIADFIPGSAIVKRSCLVICNGGSPGTHQALCAGKPVIGIASNLDQFLNMQALVKTGAAILLRADRLDLDEFGKAVRNAVSGNEMTAAAAQFAKQLGKYDYRVKFPQVLEKVGLPTPCTAGSSVGSK